MYKTKMLSLTEAIQNNSLSFFRGVLTGRINQTRWSPLLPWQKGVLAKLTGQFGRIEMFKFLRLKEGSLEWRDTMQYAAMHNQAEFLRYHNVRFDPDIDSNTHLKVDIPEWHQNTLLPSVLSLNGWSPVLTRGTILFIVESFLSVQILQQTITYQLILPSDKITPDQTLLEYIASVLVRPREFLWLLENGAFLGDRSESSILSLVTFLAQKTDPSNRYAHNQVIKALLSCGHRVSKWLAMLVYYQDVPLIESSLESFTFEPIEFQVAITVANHRKNEDIKNVLRRYYQEPVEDHTSLVSWTGIKYPSHFTQQEINIWTFD